MAYSCQINTHQIYDKIIEIIIEESGKFETPFQVIDHAKLLKKTLSPQKVKFLINDEVVEFKNLGLWAKNEYELLPKCNNCYRLLQGDVATHRLAAGKLFCGSKCADINFHQMMDKIHDEEEIEYL